MSDRETVEPGGKVKNLQEAMAVIEQVTVQFPISQLVFSWPDTFKWLFDDVTGAEGEAVPEIWLQRDESTQRRFVERWRFCPTEWPKS